MQDARISRHNCSRITADPACLKNAMSFSESSDCFLVVSTLSQENAGVVEKTDAISWRGFLRKCYSFCMWEGREQHRNLRKDGPFVCVAERRCVEVLAARGLHVAGCQYVTLLKLKP